MADWKFYGRREQLTDLERMLNRNRWFFAKVTGRRRIGKTTLIQRAMLEVGSKQPVFYLQIPDSEPAGVLSAVNHSSPISAAGKIINLIGLGSHDSAAIRPFRLSDH